MKTQNKILIFLASTMFYNFGLAQIGIGTQTPNTSAMLDINVATLAATAKKGVLFPKINLSGRDDISTITAPETGLLVYNIAGASTLENKVFPTSIYYRQPLKWEKYSSLTEVIGLKQISEYALSSTTNHAYDATELATLNDNTKSLPLTWVSNEIIIDNPTDIQLQTDNTSLLVKTTGFYQISGMLNFTPKATDTDASVTSSGYVVLTFQRSSNNGTSWTNFAGSALPYEYGVTDMIQTIILPASINQLTAGEIIRLIVSDPSTGTTLYHTGAAITSSELSDIRKSFRISRMRNTAYE